MSRKKYYKICKDIVKKEEGYKGFASGYKEDIHSKLFSDRYFTFN